jgi:rfaE bifunctional protein nucleotidyltransferase chain/domain
VKCRWRTGGRSLLRTDRGTGRPTPEFGAVIAAKLDGALDGAGAVLVSDYGRGVAADPAVRAALARAVAHRVPVVWDPHPRGAPPVAGVTVVTPNLSEARGTAGIEAVGDGVNAALALGADLVERWDVRAVAVTLGARGAVVRHRHGACSAAPAPAVRETDPCGAGDHFAGGIAARLASGATVDEAVADAVAGAAEFVARGGGAAVRRVGDAWCQPADARVPRIPVTDLDAARALVARIRSGGGTVVATGGVFDPLHRGHAESLAAARALGDCLLVLVNSDASMRRRTGGAALLGERVAAVTALDGVDGVVPFEADDPRAVLDALRPDLWVKGGDHDPADLPETPLVRSWGGEVVVVPYRPSRDGPTPGVITPSVTSRS